VSWPVDCRVVACAHRFVACLLLVSCCIVAGCVAGLLAVCSRFKGFGTDGSRSPQGQCRRT
ncbi:MAG: hypothetical protein ACLFS0_05955, partial [Bacteroidales bacterium]